MVSRLVHLRVARPGALEVPQRCRENDDAAADDYANKRIDAAAHDAIVSVRARLSRGENMGFRRG